MDDKIVSTAIRYDRTYQEYIVEGYNAAGEHYEPADYYTSDREDAKQTAKAMVAKGGAA